MTDRHLLPRFRETIAGTVAFIVDHLPDPPTIGSASHHTPAGGDPMQLRGIPALGHGTAGGHIHGTRPDQLRWDDDRTKRPRTRNP